MPRRAGDDPADLPLMVRRDEALAHGMTSDQVRQRVRSGRWARLASGVYLRDPVADPEDTAERRTREHAERAAAAARARPDCVIGFESAAVTHGLPLVTGVPPLVQLLVPEGDWTGIRAGIRYRACRLDPADVLAGDLRVTTPTRTWLDIARTHRLPNALSCGDGALKLDLLTVDDTSWALSQLGSIRGVRLARTALSLLDGRRESPLESWSYAAFVAWQIPLPDSQVEIFDDEGFIGRVDFHWPQFRVVGEADGRLKYQTQDALYEEKRREDRLRAGGLHVIRWGWTDLASGQDRLRARVVAALSR